MKAKKLQSFSIEKLQARQKRYAIAAWILGVITFVLICYISVLILKEDSEPHTALMIGPPALLIGSVKGMIKRRKEVKKELEARQ